ncbi:MAG: MBL fold metallo-hydrolase [Melioribacteraceae bacterium]|nr:MBL fold metallo-hydrolase [Melioribacteraceae bacterium]MCF8265999.1 MBL fold metallo-hydrolase [Melioribacteraceae bacterium]
MKIGKYLIKTLETGTFGLDGGAMFGIIPKPLWSRSNPADESNRITLGARCLLLISDDKKILVDTGIGNHWDEKFRNIYKVDQSENTLLQSLKNEGVDTEDISDVILTHLHFDHTGGSVIRENNNWVPAFPNAKYLVQKAHYDWAINPSDRDRGSFIRERFMPLVETGMLNFTNEENRFDDLIQFIPINGHTIFQQMVKISDSSKTLLYAGDLLPTSSHVPIPYVMGYDIQPLETVKEKLIILPQAVNEEWILFFEHDPQIMAGQIQKTEKGFSLKKTFLELV